MTNYKSRTELYEILINIINENFGVNIQDSTRKRAYTDGRMIFYHISKKHINKNVSDLSRYLNQNHATAIHALKLCKDLIDFDKSFRQKIDYIESTFMIQNKPKSERQMFEEARENRMYWERQEVMWEERVRANEMVIS